MIPRTMHNLDVFPCLSAMQKYIRRGMEREAMEFACEIGHTSKAFSTMVCNRLEIVAHEDIGLANPQVIPFVTACTENARRHYDPEKLGKWRMMIGNAIRFMCASAKSREADHFQGAVGFQNLLNGFVPQVPDWALDQHTMKGRKMGRGLDHFREEGAKLIPPPEKDQYEDECYEMWALRDAKKAEAE